MMQVSISASAGRGLPPTAARRIGELGFGATVTREGLVKALKARRAADLFIHTWSRRGMLVPLAWGSYWIPDERTASLVLAARAPHQGALLATAAALRGPLRLGRPAGFMGPAIWRGTDLSAAAPGLTVPLTPADETLPPVPPQLDPFFCDLAWPVLEARVSVGAVGDVRVPLVAPGDVAWILQLNLDPRIRAAGERLASTLSPSLRRRVAQIRRLANYPALAPPPSRPHSIPRAGPPHQYRLYSPAWYFDPHLAALQAQARRRPRAR